MTLLLAVVGAGLGVGLLCSGALELLWGLWALLTWPFRRD